MCHNHNLLWHKLFNSGSPEKYIIIIKFIYDNAFKKIKVNDGELSERIPFLFSIIVSDIESFFKWKSGIPVS